MNINFEIPDSWLQLTVGEIIEYGKADKAEPTEIPDDAWVLELEDIEKDTSKLLERITFGQRQSKSTKNRFSAGDVLYGKLRPYLNKVLIADSDGYCTQKFFRSDPIKPLTGISYFIGSSILYFSITWSLSVMV
jgi:type I restriction enzyme S subunit